MSERVPPFTAGVNRVIVSPSHRFMFLPAIQYSNSRAEIKLGTPWSPLRRYGRAPPSTARDQQPRRETAVVSEITVLIEPVAPLERAVNARVRERVTANQIQLLRHLERPHRGRKGTQADGTARVASHRIRGWRHSTVVSSAVQGDTVSTERSTRHTPRGAHALSTNRSTRK